MINLGILANLWFLAPLDIRTASLSYIAKSNWKLTNLVSYSYDIKSELVKCREFNWTVLPVTYDRIHEGFWHVQTFSYFFHMYQKY